MSKELLTTKRPNFEVAGEQYTLKIGVYHDYRFQIETRLYRTTGWFERTTIDRSRRLVGSKAAVEREVDDVIEWALDRAKERESARKLDIEVEVTQS